MRIAGFPSLLLLASMLPASSLAQDIGHPEQGRHFAAEVCSPCHSIGPDILASPRPDAPAFADVAKTKGMTAISLTAWLQTSHPTMPNIIVKDADMRNVIAYILSLKRD